MTNEITCYDDTIDSRDIIERIEELGDELQTEYDSKFEDMQSVYDTWLKDKDSDIADMPTEPPQFDAWVAEQAAQGTDLAESAQEYIDLQEVAEQAEGCADWRYGETLIRESYFEKYCQELVEDIGDLPNGLPGYLVIDWKATADNLRVDYTDVEFNGVTYLVRA